ncbi:unnamed protein product, partial [Polarella glacialis]
MLNKDDQIARLTEQVEIQNQQLQVKDATVQEAESFLEVREMELSELQARMQKVMKRNRLLEAQNADLSARLMEAFRGPAEAETQPASPSSGGCRRFSAERLHDQASELLDKFGKLTQHQQRRQSASASAPLRQMQRLPLQQLQRQLDLEQQLLYQEQHLHGGDVQEQLLPERRTAARPPSPRRAFQQDA